MVRKYGEDHVAQIITFGTMQEGVLSEMLEGLLPYHIMS